VSYLIHLDFETFSEVDLRKAGAYRYAQDPSTIVLCMSFAVGLEKPRRWVPGQPITDFTDIQMKRRKPFKNLRKFRWAGHNCQFEYLIWKYVCVPKYGWPEPPPYEKWIDTAAIVRYHGLPGALDKAAKALHLPQNKDDKGKRIMMKLARPRKPSKANPDLRWTPETKPDDFEALYAYCDQDVVVERAIHKKLGDLPPIEQRIWIQNNEINDVGVPVDIELAKQVLIIKEQFTEDINKKIKKLTKGEADRATQTARITKFLGIDSLAKDFLINRDKSSFTKKENKLIELRLAGSQTSTAKFEALLTAVCDDGRLHGLFMYHAANQTARYGGSLIQPHNLPRPVIPHGDIKKVVKVLLSDKRTRNKINIIDMHTNNNLMGALKSCIRAALYAGEDHVFVVSDFASVEARKLAWVAGCKKLIDIFNSGGSPYLDMGRDLFGRKIKKTDDFEYFISKQLILGAGYSMSGKRFQGECESKGIDIDLEFAEEAIKAYRERYEEIPAVWRAVNYAAIKAVETSRPQSAARCTFIYKQFPFPKLICILPSGREMSYPYPSIKWIWPPWDSDTKIKQLHYWTVEQKTYRWVCKSTYGGSLVENICQGSCRDILCSRMLAMKKKKLPVVLHVHDEAGALVKIENKKRAVKLMSKLMSEAPPWAVGLPLSEEGYAARRYRK
jgi:DNA polymerase